MSLLGSMLLDREAIGLVLSIIPRDESARFYRPDHRVLFETLVDLYDRNQPIDLIVLEDELRRRNQLEEIGGRDYLLELSHSVPSSANSEYYARIVRDKSLLRDLISCAMGILQNAYDQREPAVQILDDSEKLLYNVTQQRVSQQAVPIRELLNEAFRQLESAEDGAITGVPTGFTALDQLLGGLQSGDLIVIAARPSMGKTSLGLSMLEYVGFEERIPAAFFSMEMSKLQIAQRLLCAKARVDMSRLRQGRLSGSEIQRLQLVCENMRAAPVFVDDTPGMSVMEVRAKIRRLKMLHDIRVAFIDYLQLMHDRLAARESRQQEIASISRGLKALGRELNIPIVALAQLNRQVEGRTSNRPRMSDLRESGAIEQDADVVILLHREEYYWDKKKRTQANEEFSRIQGKAELIVDKQRNGPTGVVELHFHEQYARFDNAAPGYMPEEAGYSAAHEEIFDEAAAYGDPAASDDREEDVPF